MIERDRPGDLRGARAKVFRARRDMHEWLHSGPDRSRTSDLIEDLLTQIREWVISQGGTVCVLHIAFDQDHDDRGRRARWKREGVSLTSEKDAPRRVFDTIMPKPGDEYATADATVYFEVSEDYVEPEPVPIPIQREWTPVEEGGEGHNS